MCVNQLCNKNLYSKPFREDLINQIPFEKCVNAKSLEDLFIEISSYLEILDEWKYFSISQSCDQTWLQYAFKVDNASL